MAGSMEGGQRSIVIVGAGLAGLVCARQLRAAGRHVLVLEGKERVGGRVGTTVTREGYRLDLGFQVIFAAYPALLRQVQLNSLMPRYFSSSTSIVHKGLMLTVGHPLYAPDSVLPAVRSGLIRPRDGVALGALLVRARSFGDAPLPAAGCSTREALRVAGASPDLIENLVTPFYGGISFDRSLSSDAAFFGLVLRSLAAGRSFVPAHGMQQLPDLLARDLPPGVLRLGTRVDRLEVEDGAVRGVVADGKTVEAETVVVATAAPDAARLTGAQVPPGERGCTTVYFAGARPLYAGKRTVVHAEPSLVNEVVQMSNVAPEYAPTGRHLLSATVLHAMDGSDDAVARAVEDDVRSWMPGAAHAALEAVGVIRVPYAQFAQPPGIYARLPGPVTATRGLYLAGEYLHSSSIQGAMRGGEMAAAAVLRGA